MPKGKVVALYGEHGQVMCESQVYNFNTMVVEGGVSNQQDVEFELENGEWISPEILSNEVFSDLDTLNNAVEQNVLSVPDEDD